MVIKRCGCGREYTRERWLALERVGVQVDDVETLELRNCVCGSTIAVVISGPTEPISALVVALAAMLVGCGGAPFAAEDVRPDAEALEASPETSQRVDAGRDAEVDAGRDAPAIDAPMCVTDLSNVGTADFHISFTVATTETGLQIDILRQRVGCDYTSAWWDIELTPSGGMEFDVNGADAGPYGIESGNSLNDGLPHTVVFQRVAGVIQYGSDGIIHPGSPPDPLSFGPLPPLTFGSEACGGTILLAGHGTLSDLCVTSP